MRTIGLIFMGDEPRLLVGGIPIAERQARQLRRAGVTAIRAVDVVPLTVLPAGVEPVAAGDLATAIAADDLVVVMAPDLVTDERALALLLAASAPALLVDPVPLPADPMAGNGAERIDAASISAGLLLLPGAMVRSVAASLGDWDLASTLLRAAVSDPATRRVDFAAIPLYAANRRREVPLVWAQPRTPEAARATTVAVIAAAQKGCLDWPARFIHPPIEDALVRLLAPTPITPNMVTIATGIIGIAAGIAFAQGALWWGLALALVTGPLDGVDGKLARTRIEFSKWGDLEHLLDKLLEYGWYLAIAGHFAAVSGSALPWAVAALIILPALAEAVQGEVFRRLTGGQLDDAGPLERRLRLISGRRNTFLWTWAGFAAVGEWFAGFVMIAAYSILTTAVAQWRFYARLTAYGRDHGATIAANLKATGYDFLPPSGVSTK